MEELLEKILLLREALRLIDTSDESESDDEPEPEPEPEIVYDSESDYIDDGPYRKRKRTKP